jgi:putative transposase
MGVIKTPAKIRINEGTIYSTCGDESDLFRVHAAIYNTFYTQRHLISRRTLRELRTAAMEEWRLVVAAA